MHAKSALALPLVFISALAQAQMVSLPLSALSPELRQRVARFNASASSARLSILAAPTWSILNKKDEDSPSAIRKAIAEDLIGKGYDLWSGGLFSKCVTPAAITFRPLSADGRNPHNVYNVRQIETLAEHQEDRSSGANASITYKLISFGGSTAESSGSVFKKTNQYIDIFIRYVGDEYSANGGSPTTTAAGALQGPGGIERFSKLCGQEFISRVGFGVQLDARMMASIAINETSRQNKSDVSVGFGKLLSLGADSASTVQEISQHATLSASIVGAGGVQPKPDELMEYARKFGENNPAAISSQEIYIETTPYSQVAYKIFAAFDDLTMRAAGTVLDLNADRLAIVQQRAEIDTAIANPKYYWVNGAEKTTAELSALRKVHSDYLDALGDVWSTCRKALDDAGIKKCKETKVPARPETLDIRLAKQTP